MADKIQCKMSVYEESTVLRKIYTVIALNLLILRKVIREAWTTLWKYHSIFICGQKKIECWYLLEKKLRAKRRWHYMYINPFSTAYYKSCVSLLPLKGNFERNCKIYTKNSKNGQRKRMTLTWGKPEILGFFTLEERCKKMCMTWRSCIGNNYSLSLNTKELAGASLSYQHLI